ncbi:MAG TPA: PEGA domain-containing protein [Vicinamibacterales bacterium]
MSALPPKSPATVTPFSDALGYRVLGFDKKSGDRLEMLRLRPQLASSPAFEAAARERQRQLADFRHPAFARVRQMDRPANQPGALAIVSNYAEGQRLSDVLRAAATAGVTLDLVTAVCLLRQVVASVARLHELGEHISHGTLGPERLVVTANGRVVLTEYVVGAGLAAMGITPQQAWQDYKLALSPSGTPFDQAADIYQLGYLGLTLVYGRSIYDRAYPPPFADLLQNAQELTLEGRPQPLHPGIAGWIGRALQLEAPAFASAADAQTALDEAIASAGLVATPDVVVELLARCNGGPDSAARSISEAAPAPPASPAPPAPAPPAPEMSAIVSESASAWTPPAEPAPELPPFPRRESGSHRAAGTRLPLAAEETASLPVPAPEAPATPAEPASDPLDAPLAAQATEAASPDLELAARPWTPRAEPETPKPVRTRSQGTLFSQAAEEPEPGAAAASAAAPVKVRRPYLVALGMAVVMVVIFEVVLRLFNPFGGTPAEAISTSELTAQKGTLVIDSTPHARVFIDDQPHGTTPARVELAPGRHSVRLEADGHGRTLDVNVIAGRETTQIVELGRIVDTGTIEVRSEPAGARVSIDGKPAGVTPLTVTDVKPGAHVVAVEGPAGPIRQVVQVVAGSTAAILAPLTAPAAGTGSAAAAATPAAAPTVGWITVESPEELQVYAGGKLLGTSRTARLPLEAGSHDIQLRNDAVGFSTMRNVQVEGGKVSRVTVQLPDGSLSLNAIPWAEVWLDGNRIGETPIGNVTARAGTHELIFRHPDHAEIRQTVVVKAGEINRVTVNMTK